MGGDLLRGEFVWGGKELCESEQYGRKQWEWETLCCERLASNPHHFGLPHQNYQDAPTTKMPEGLKWRGYHNQSPP